MQNILHVHREAPAQVQFANRVSCSMYNQFVDESIQELVKVGSLVEMGGA